MASSWYVLTNFVQSFHKMQTVFMSLQSGSNLYIFGDVNNSALVYSQCYNFDSKKGGRPECVQVNDYFTDSFLLTPVSNQKGLCNFEVNNAADLVMLQSVVKEQPVTNTNVIVSEPVYFVNPLFEQK